MTLTRAFVTREQINQAVASVLGELLPGRPEQDPHVESAVQNYKIGSRLKLLDGTTWHYCLAGAFGIPASQERAAVSSVAPETLATIGASAVGTNQVVITDANVLHTADYWANGKVELWTAVPQHRTIRSSTASNGTSVTLTLNFPLVALAATGTGLEICRCMYASVDGVGIGLAQQKSCVGASLAIVTPLNFFWVQTWGMCTMGARYGTMGAAADSRDVYYNGINGTIQDGIENGTYTQGMQRIGFLLPDTVSGGETVIMLQLDP